jgi:hypothetical protein
MSGFVLYLITVRLIAFSLLAAAKAALRSQGRLEPAKGYVPLKNLFVPLRDTYSLSPDWQTRLGPERQMIT